MEQWTLDRFSNVLSRLIDLSTEKVVETTTGLVVGGMCSDEVVSCLKKISEFFQTFSVSSTAIVLRIDGAVESWDDCSFDDCIESTWTLSVSDKLEVLRFFNLTGPDANSLIFFNRRYFVDDWLATGAGLANPERCLMEYVNKPLRIYVQDLDVCFGGPKLAVVPVSRYSDSLPGGWLGSTKLPTKADILKSVHVVSSESIDIDPERFLITWGDVSSFEAGVFHRASCVLLLISICQEFFSKDKVVLNGKKKLELVVYKDLNSSNLDMACFDSLRQAVEWCYAENDASTRLLLLVDRLSLDIKDGCSLWESMSKLAYAFDEAKSRYRYVVLERKKDYVKELSDLQKEVSNVVASISQFSLGLSNAFLKDVLALGFVLTIGTVSRVLVSKDLVVSTAASVLFKSFSIYLVFSLFIRFWQAWSAAFQEESVFKSWRNILRGHMSEGEMNERIYNSLFPVKLILWVNLVGIGFLYSLLALFSWNAISILKFLGILA